MELTKGVVVDYVEGEIVAKVKVKEVALAKIAELKAKFESGEIDLIKGTDLDKKAALAVFAAIEAAL